MYKGGDSMEEKLYSIKDVSKITGIKETTLRKYERDFEIKIPKNEQGYRYYTEKEINLYSWIKSMKEKGAGTEIIKNLLEKSMDAIEQKEQALELVTIDRLTGAELKEVMLKQMSEILLERDRMYLEKIEQVKEGFEQVLDKRLQDQEQRIREQIQSENKKLMDYVAASREEEKKESKGFVSKLLGFLK